MGKKVLEVCVKIEKIRWFPCLPSCCKKKIKMMLVVLLKYLYMILIAIYSQEGQNLWDTTGQVYFLNLHFIGGARHLPKFTLFVESDSWLACGQETDISCLKIKGQESSWHKLAVERKTYFVSFDHINIHSNTMEFAYILDEAAKLSNYDKVFFSITIWSIYAQKLNQDTVCSCHGNFLANEDCWHSWKKIQWHIII